MAGPAFLLIVLFLITPFFMAVGFSFTNQRLVSPNPTEWVGTRNYERLFGIATLTLEAERAADGSRQDGGRRARLPAPAQIYPKP